MKYAVDMIGIFRLFYDFLIQYEKDELYSEERGFFGKQYDEDPEAFLACLSGGLFVDYFVPDATKFLNCGYYKNIDFCKLLLRQYDLETVLDLNCAQLFDKYSQVGKLKTNSASAADLHVFPSVSKSVFLRKNNLEYLQGEYTDIAETFIDI